MGEQLSALKKGAWVSNSSNQFYAPMGPWSGLGLNVVYFVRSSDLHDVAEG